MVKSALNLSILLFFQYSAPVLSVTRQYFISAEEQFWDYCPTQTNWLNGQPAADGVGALYVTRTDQLIGSMYKKALYREYTDATFTELKPQPAHLGTLGPTLRAEIGDSIEVTFFNNATFPYTAHPHGVAYLAEFEGIPNVQLANGGVVPPGQMFVYEWTVPARSGPTDMDGNAVAWLYHSHTDEVTDINSGLYGALIVYAPGVLDPESGLPTDVDSEFVLIFQVNDENSSHYISDSCTAAGFTCPTTTGMRTLMSMDMGSSDFEESNRMHGVNGYLYANLPGLDMDVNSKVRWIVASLGGEMDLHTAHWHGNTLTYQGHVTDVAELLPAAFHVLDMQPDMEGVWQLHCHVNEHIAAGMTANYTVHSVAAS